MPLHRLSESKLCSQSPTGSSITNPLWIVLCTSDDAADEETVTELLILRSLSELPVNPALLISSCNGLIPRSQTAICVARVWNQISLLYSHIARSSLSRPDYVLVFSVITCATYPFATVYVVHK